MIRNFIVAIAICMPLSTIALADCSVSDFDVQGFAAEVDRCVGARCPRLRLSGTLINNCSVAAAAQIEIKALDSNGRVVNSIEGWPVATANLAPGETQDFDFGRLMRYRNNMVEFSIAITEARVW